MFVVNPDAIAGTAPATRCTDCKFCPIRAAHDRLLRHPPKAFRKRSLSKSWPSLAFQQPLSDGTYKFVLTVRASCRWVEGRAPGGCPRRRPAIPEHAHDRPRHHLRRLHAAPERTRRHPRAPGRGASTLCGMGTTRGRKIDDRAAGFRRRCPQICRRPRAPARPRRPPRHPVARRGRPHPLGAAGLSASFRRSRPLPRQPGRAAVGGADGAGRPVSARRSSAPLSLSTRSSPETRSSGDARLGAWRSPSRGRAIARRSAVPSLGPGDTERARSA